MYNKTNSSTEKHGWWGQLLVRNVVFHLHFGPNCRTPQRSLCVLTDLFILSMLNCATLYATCVLASLDL